MRNKKKWSALVLAVIMVASVTLSGCRKEREKINVGTENNTLVTTESESESETKKESESKKESETQKESETKTSESNQTQSESNNTTNNGTSANNGAGSNGGSSDNSTSSGGNADGSSNNGGSSDNGTSSGGNTGGSSNNGGSSDNNGGDNAGSENGENGNGTTTSTEAPRYFFAGDGSRVDVSQLPDGSWQDANGTTYTFYENGVEDSNGNWFYYDPPATGNTTSNVGDQADFYDSQGNHIICTLDENGFWVDTEGNTYTFKEDGVTNNATGEFYPW